MRNIERTSLACSYTLLLIAVVFAWRNCPGFAIVRTVAEDAFLHQPVVFTAVIVVLKSSKENQMLEASSSPTSAFAQVMIQKQVHLLQRKNGDPVVTVPDKK